MKKPSPEEVIEYALSLNFKLDGQQFCDYYESKGWVVGRSPMKSWKASVRLWKSTSHRFGTPIPSYKVPEPEKIEAANKRAQELMDREWERREKERRAKERRDLKAIQIAKTTHSWEDNEEHWSVP